MKEYRYFINYKKADSELVMTEIYNMQKLKLAF
jgi:hypothetical protein